MGMRENLMYWINVGYNELLVGSSRIRHGLMKGINSSMILDMPTIENKDKLQERHRKACVLWK